MAIEYDSRFGPGYPNCGGNTGRRTVHLDFGLGQTFDDEYQSGAIAPLLRAVLKIKTINDDPHDSRKYRVTVAGTFACRAINNPHEPGSQTPSNHSWPTAIDINPANNSFNGGRGDIPQWFIDVFTSEGFTWGGTWGDPMHFENLKWYGMWDGKYPVSYRVQYELIQYQDGKPVAGQTYSALEPALNAVTDRAKGLRKLAPKSTMTEVNPSGGEEHFRYVWRAVSKMRKQLEPATPAVIQSGRNVGAAIKIQGSEHLHSLRVMAERTSA
jgi:hypothetical protein